MSKHHTFEGSVTDLGERFTAPSGFTKQTIAVRDDAHNGKYDNIIPFVAKKDNVNLVEGLRVGDKVRIDYAMEGHKWVDPKSGKNRYFIDLTIHNLVRIGQDGKPDVPPPAEPSADAKADDDSDMPF